MDLIGSSFSLDDNYDGASSVVQLTLVANLFFIAGILAYWVSLMPICKIELLIANSFDDWFEAV